MYYIIGLQGLQGIYLSNAFEGWLQAFFFSAQTITTLGYGGIHPTGIAASSVAAVESLAGLFSFALATGLLYGRFSKPAAKILYSENALIAPYRGITAFEFRIVNKRISQLIEVEVELIYLHNELMGNVNKRQFYTLKLERNKINFFASNWTIVHPITDESPLYLKNWEDLKKSDAEFFVMIKAFDNTFSQTVYSRSSYKAEEIIWGAKYLSMVGINDKGKDFVDIKMLNLYEEVSLID